MFGTQTPRRRHWVAGAGVSQGGRMRLALQVLKKLGYIRDPRGSTGGTVTTRVKTHCCSGSPRTLRMGKKG